MKTKQTFKKGKTITELWIDVTRKFEVIEDGGFFYKWDIIELIKDDNTNCPKFKNQDCIISHIFLFRLAYVDNEIKRWDIVWVSDISQEDADIDFRDDTDRYYIWKNRKWQFVAEHKDWYLFTCNYISNKKQEEITIEEMTLDEVCKELWRDIKIIK